MPNKWLCLTIGISFHHGNKESASGKIKEIFGNDLKKAIFVHNDVMWRTGEYFCFVLCSNYESHIGSLGKNSTFFHVVPSIEKPGWLTSKEVRKFVSSMKGDENRKVFRKGDFVKVGGGRFKNLYGLVMEAGKKHKYRVVFRFCLKEIMTVISGNLLQFAGNIFGGRRLPVAKKGLKEKPVKRDTCSEVSGEDVNRYKLYRKEHRKHSAARWG